MMTSTHPHLVYEFSPSISLYAIFPMNRCQHWFIYSAIFSVFFFSILNRKIVCRNVWMREMWMEKSKVQSMSKGIKKASRTKCTKLCCHSCSQNLFICKISFIKFPSIDAVCVGFNPLQSTIFKISSRLGHYDSSVWKSLWRNSVVWLNRIYLNKKARAWNNNKNTRTCT